MPPKTEIPVGQSAAGAGKSRAIEVDARGHVFVAGETGGAFGESENFGSFDVFVAELDGTGKWLASYQFGTAGDDRANAEARLKEWQKVTPQKTRDIMPRCHTAESYQ